MTLLQKTAEIIIHAGIIQGFFMAMLLNRPKKNYANILLSFILVVMSVIIFHSYYIKSIIGELIKSPFLISEPFIFLLGPLFYFYVRNLVNPAMRIKLNDSVHFIPFLLFFISFIPVYLHGRGSLYYNFLYNNSLILTILLWLIVISQFVFYLVKTARLTHIHKSHIEEEYSGIEGFDISWIKIFLWVSLEVLVFMMVVLVIIVHKGNFESFGMSVALLFSVALFFISYKGLKQKIITQKEEMPSQVLETEERNEKNAEKMEALKEELLQYMDKNKPFLNPDLTLTDLAKDFGISRNNLSYLINNNLGDSFYNFVNRYRIEEVKKLMNTLKGKNLTLVALAFEAGFNSKSSFNNIFKKNTGLTPSEYRNGLN